MTAPSDTKPWLEDDCASPHVRAMLASARGDGPSPADLERLAARLAPVAGVAASALIAQGVPPAIAPAAPAPVAAAAALGKFTWPVVWKALCAACVLGVGAVAVLPPGGERPERVVARPVAVLTPSVPPAAGSAPSAVAAHEPAIAPPAPVPPATPVAKVHAATPPSELSLIQAAQDQRDPARALAILQRHARFYPDGTFAQEREVLAVGALVALGRREEAEARADRLARRYPDSAHLRRVRVLLEGPSGR